MQQLLYYLPFLACPVGMGLMMWLMMRGNKQNPSSDMSTMRHSALLGANRYLWREDAPTVDQAPSDAQLPDGRTREEQLATLHTRLATLQERQQALMAEMREMQEPEQAHPGELSEREQRV